MKRNLFTTVIIILLIITSGLLLKSWWEDSNHETPKQLIATDVAKSLNQNYINQRSPLIEQSINRQDANAVWYSIEELENYIYYAKCEADKNDQKISGVRFYLGVYPNDTLTYHEKAGLTTVFLSPTVKRNPNLLKPQRFQPAPVSSDPNIDADNIQPLNFGSMGHPPKVVYPITQN